MCFDYYYPAYFIHSKNVPPLHQHFLFFFFFLFVLFFFYYFHFRFHGTGNFFLLKKISYARDIVILSLDCIVII